MKLDCYRDFARFEVLRDKNGDTYLMVADLLEVRLVDIERIETRFGCGVVVWCHDVCDTCLNLKEEPRNR